MVSKYYVFGSSKLGPVALNDPAKPLVIFLIPWQTSTFLAISHLTVLQVTFHMPAYCMFKRDRGSPSLKLTFPLILYQHLPRARNHCSLRARKEHSLSHEGTRLTLRADSSRRYGAESLQYLEAPTERFSLVLKTKDCMYNNESDLDSIQLYANAIIKFI